MGGRGVQGPVEEQTHVQDGESLLLSLPLELQRAIVLAVAQTEGGLFSMRELGRWH